MKESSSLRSSSLFLKWRPRCSGNTHIARSIDPVSLGGDDVHHDAPVIHEIEAEARCAASDDARGGEACKKNSLVPSSFL